MVFICKDIGIFRYYNGLFGFFYEVIWFIWDLLGNYKVYWCIIWIFGLYVLIMK